VYEVLDEKMRSCRKPVFPVLPSILTAAEEVKSFLSKGWVNFPDEVQLGNALTKVRETLPPPSAEFEIPAVDVAAIRSIISDTENGYISPQHIQGLLDAAGITRAHEAVVTTEEQAIETAGRIGYPLVMKVVGPVHKSDVGGVALNVTSENQLIAEFDRMMQINDTEAILMQPMLRGTELFAGAKAGPGFGHMILCGMGGIFIEVLKDVSTCLTPVSPDEAQHMLSSLRSYAIIKGVRGQKPINEKAFIEIILRLSALVDAAPEIAELDLNPLLGNEDTVVAVDARIRIEKS
jgi:acetate---CoA ligase (ADP-forming)